MIGLDVAVFTLLAIPVLGCATYLFVLSVFATRADANEGLAGDTGPARMRFDIVVPAHDEEAGIAATIASLQALDYPKDHYRVLVVADNCTDATAHVARVAGATVLERRDPGRRGKGHALAFAFDRVERYALADAVVVIDADTTVSPNLLRAFARRFESGASVLQADYGARDPEASWRARLMVIALSLFHGVRSLGRERLGLSAGLRGNGMGLSREVLRRVPPDAFSIVEDVEYGITLGEAGVRVAYVSEARVLGDMAPRGAAAASQRRRWEQGRRAIARARAPRLITRGLARRDAVLLDLALDLLTPPLASLSLAAGAGTAAALLWYRVFGGSPLVAIPWLLSAGFLAVYVLRGLVLSGSGIRGVFTLLWAPVYVGWKIGLRWRRPVEPSNEWVRTAREGRP